MSTFSGRLLSEFSGQVVQQAVAFGFSHETGKLSFQQYFITHFLQHCEGIRSGKKPQIIKKWRKNLKWINWVIGSCIRTFSLVANVPFLLYSSSLYQHYMFTIEKLENTVNEKKGKISKFLSSSRLFCFQIFALKIFSLFNKIAFIS